MKLLRKSEVTALKEREKVREASEGIKIARRVDELRELQAREAQKLDDFRSSSLKAIGEEIKKLGEQRDYLAAEVSSLEVKLAAMMPGMEMTRNALAKREKNIESAEKLLSAKQEQLQLAELDILEAKKAASDSIMRATTQESAAKRAVLDAEHAKAESLSRLAQAKSIEARAHQEKQSQDADIAVRSGVLASKEREIAEKGELLTMEEKKLTAEKVKLEDRKRMIERTMERLRQQRLNVG